jgi:TPP-dependent pyruvate/acetoin dehydrogenase alpha subunit
LAFADKYLDNGRVTFTYFGDGAGKPRTGLRNL